MADLSPQARLVAILEQREAGYVDAAIAQLQTLLEAHPTFVKGWLELGHSWRMQDDLAQACGCYQRILDFAPNNLWAHLQLGKGRLASGDDESAYFHLNTAAEAHPQNPLPLVHLGELALEQQQIDTALNWFDQALQLDPTRPEPYLKKVATYLKCQDFTTASATLDRLFDYHPQNFWGLCQRGKIAQQQGDRQQALHWFRQAADVAPSPARHRDVQLWILEELRTLGQLDAARQEIEAAPCSFQQHPRTQMLLGSILQRQQEFELAATSYQQILQQQPEHAPATVELARCWSQSGQFPEAIALLHDYTNHHSPHAHVWLMLAQLYQQVQAFEQAQHWYERTLELNPHSPSAYCGFAECSVQQGAYDEAMTTLTQSQSLLPHAVQLWLKQGQLAQRYGNVDQCFAIFQQAQTKFPTHVPVQLDLAQLHIRGGQYEDAIALLNAITTDHHDWRKRILNQRGEIALLQFNLDRAEHYYGEAIALHPPQQAERMQLARIYLSKGALESAYHQLVQATQDLAKQSPPGPVGLPIKNHISTIINEFYINPLRLEQLNVAKAEEGRDRLLALASIITEEPTYLGATITLAQELHRQGIWADLRTSLSMKQPCGIAIPKRIVQFWDDPNPPPEVQQLGQTWLEHNPDYDYQRFSLREAIAFLQQHYAPDITNAFYHCSHPAAQADFFRLAYLNCYGGFYADADDRCRRSLEPLRQSHADLVLHQEDFACFGNNFLGSVPHCPIIRSALYQATTNLLEYSAEWAWSQTGPGLLTSAVCSGLLPYLAHTDYRLWPRLLVLSRGELAEFVWSHVPLAYKKTEKNWQNQAYPKTRLALPMS